MAQESAAPDLSPAAAPAHLDAEFDELMTSLVAQDVYTNLDNGEW